MTNVREIERGDIDTVVAMVHELAAFEREPDRCTLTAEQLSAVLFADQPTAFCDVATLDDGSVAGFAIWFVTFSTWTGMPGIHLEDLYVRPEARGTGVGRALMARLAARCVERGWRRFEWNVLDWNVSARNVYQALGAEAVDGWVPYRLDGAALTALAGRN